MKENDFQTKAAALVDSLLVVDVRDLEKRKAKKASIEGMGLDLQMKAAAESELFNQPLKKMSDHSQEGSEVATSLTELKLKVEELDPGKFNFDPGWFGRLLSRLPGVGTPVKRYFTQFESAQTVVSGIVRALERGRDQLLRDNVTLEEDQKIMKMTSVKLENAIELGKVMDQLLQQKLDQVPTADEPRRSFISEELLFPLRQRIIDLQTQVAVHQQGILAMELIVRNNAELVRGVNRALNVTVTALRVGATVAMALAHQKIVLEQVTSVNQTTSDLIAGTAARLKSQGTEIHRQATESQLNMDSLRAAFRDLRDALQQVSDYRAQALPKMAETVLELDRLNRDAQKSIAQMEKGNQAKADLLLESGG